MTPTIRTALASDREFLVDMLVEAANWSPNRPALSRDEVLSTPALAHYVDGWPRPDDLGVVATVGGRPVGAAWLRYLRSDDPGFGWVADDVPELSVAVVAGRRGDGVGARLLAALVDRARTAGIGAISLSVEVANPAHRLYERLGFEDVAGADHAATMVLDLGRDGSRGH